MTLPVGRGEHAPSRWDPVREIEDTWARMGNLFQNVFGELGTRPFGQWAAGWSTPVDIEETDDAYVVEVDLPGARPEDVSVELTGSDLHVSGEVKEKERGGVLRRQTRRVGRFDYRVTLPGEVNPDGVEASLKEGVLTVRLAKAASSQARRIQITSS